MTAPVLHDASDLAATVQRAAALLDQGDVEAALMFASAAYDTADAAARFARRMRAGQQLVDKARRLQGDALLIEARAKIKLAADHDAAQAAGLIPGHGGDRKSKISKQNLDPSLADTGMTPQQVFEARKLAEAERRSPGIVERAIAARLAAGLEPSRANLRAAVGTASATKQERGANLYETPPEAMTALLALEQFQRRIYEPACGRGAIVRPLEAAGHDVALSDLVDYGTATGDGECQGVVDFMATGRGDGDYDIITNPPYGEALNSFVAHAIRVHRPKKMALLLNLNFLAGFVDEDRNFALDDNPPARILVFTRRLPMMHRDGYDGPEASSRMNIAWFIWEREGDLETGAYAGRREVSRIDWQAFDGADPLGVGQ